MTAEEFRTLALSLPEASEDAHMGHPDFRVRGKIFATLGPDEDWGMVKLPPDDQADLLDEGGAYEPAKGNVGASRMHDCTTARREFAESPRSTGHGVAEHGTEESCPG